MKCKKCKKREANCCHYLHWEEKPLKGDHRLIQKKHPKWFIDICQRCHDKIHGIEVKRGQLRRLVVELVKTQKARMAIKNQERSLGRLDFVTPKHFADTLKIFNDAEKRYEKEIKELLESGDYPVWDYLKNVRGISYKLGAKLLAYIDITKAARPSSVWQFCGYGDPEDKRKKGYRLKHNPELKTFCFQIGESFIKSKSPYKKIYDETKKKELEKVKTRMHAHKRAIRKMIKAFLLDLYLNWRKAEGLEITEEFRGLYQVS